MSNVEMMNFSFRRSSSMMYVSDGIRKLTVALGVVVWPVIPGLGSGDRLHKARH